MKLYINRCIDEVIKLDSSPMDVMGNVKEVHITLNIFLDTSIIQYIIVVDLPPLFRIYLSRKFTTKLGGYLAFDYTHLLLPYLNKYIKISN